MQVTNQKQAIIKAFNTGKWITPLILFQLTGSMRMSARVFDLQKMGFNFEKKRVRFTTRYGTQGYYDAFRLKK